MNLSGTQILLSWTAQVVKHAFLSPMDYLTRVVILSMGGMGGGGGGGERVELNLLIGITMRIRPGHGIYSFIKSFARYHPR